MKKRGQISVFIILGILLLIGTGLVLFLRGYRIESRNAIPSGEITPIKNYIELCAKSSAQNGLVLLGLQGGYITPPEQSFSSIYTDIAYWYYDGTDTSPSRETMESELAGYLNRALPACIEELAAFKDLGYSFSFGAMQTEVSIKDNLVEFRMSYPITIIKGEQRSTITDFYRSEPVRLGHLSNISHQIVLNELAEPDWIDITYLVSQDAYFTIYPYDESTIIYSLVDNRSLEQGGDYTFLFANHFATAGADIEPIEQLSGELAETQATDDELDSTTLDEAASDLQTIDW